MLNLVALALCSEYVGQMHMGKYQQRLAEVYANKAGEHQAGYRQSKPGMGLLQDILASLCWHSMICNLYILLETLSLVTRHQGLVTKAGFVGTAQLT